MRIRMWSAALIVLALVGSSCSENQVSGPAVRTSSRLAAVNADAGSSVVISQVYGGGGNSGSVFKNDFVELHNRSAAPVSIDGWSVQYASAAGTLALDGKTFTLAHTYNVPAMYQVEVTVSDDDATSIRKQFVTVISSDQALITVTDIVRQLVASGKLAARDADALYKKIDGAQKQLDKGHSGSAANQLSALQHDIDKLVKSGALSQSDANTLTTMLDRMIRSLSLS